MNHTRIYSLFIIFALAAVSILSWRYVNGTESRSFQHEGYIDSSGQCSHEDQSLCTHLPIVVIDTRGNAMETAKIKKANSEGSRYEGVYAEANLSVIDNPGDLNHLSDDQALVSRAMIKYRGNSSIFFDKKQYLIKLIDENGRESDLQMMEMKPDDEWVLNGNFIDKSNIRNYLCYSIAGEIMDYSPDSRFCEVVIRNGETYSYQGLYLMSDSIKRGNGRVDIRKFDQELPTNSYIIRRDRYNDDENMIMSFGTLNNLTDEFIGLKYPSKAKANEKTLAYVESDISTIEEIMYAEEGPDLDRLEDYIDLDSFVDYFIINEFFANYDAGIHSTYSHKDLGGKLKMGPVWDFDRSMDNDPDYLLNNERTVINNYSWYDALFKSSKFTKMVVKRYKKLRKSVLSDEYLASFIDETAQFIKYPIERNNQVWGYIYENNQLQDIPDSNGNMIYRNTSSFEEEIDRMKITLKARGDWLDENIDSLYDYSTDSERSMLPDNMNALIFIATFLISIVIVKFD